MVHEPRTFSTQCRSGPLPLYVAVSSFLGTSILGGSAPASEVASQEESVEPASDWPGPASGRFEVAEVAPLTVPALDDVPPALRAGELKSVPASAGVEDSPCEPCPDGGATEFSSFESADDRLSEP